MVNDYQALLKGHRQSTSSDHLRSLSGSAPATAATDSPATAIFVWLRDHRIPEVRVVSGVRAVLGSSAVLR